MQITHEAINVDTDHLTRAQAIALVGDAAVVAVEKEGCEPTGKVGYNGQC